LSFSLEALAPALAYACHDRQASWHPHPPDSPTTVAEQLALWHQPPPLRPVAEARHATAPTGKPCRLILLPLHQALLRYQVVRLLSPYIPALWQIRIGARCLTVNSDSSLFLGRSEPHYKQHQAWLARQRAAHRYELVCDFRDFFGSIDHPILLKAIAYELARNCPGGLPAEAAEACAWLAKLLPVPYRPAPEDDSSATVTVLECGLPIGNTTERFFANAYLSIIDRFLLRQPGTSFSRRLDDIRIFSNDERQLRWIRGELAQLAEGLHLRLCPDKTYLRRTRAT